MIPIVAWICVPDVSSVFLETPTNLFAYVLRFMRGT